MVVTLAGQFVLAIELEGNGYMYLYFLCFLVCFEMGITEWAGLCECVRGGVIAESTGHPTELTVPCHTATATRVRMRKMLLATMVSKMRLTPLFHYILVKTLFRSHVYWAPHALDPAAVGFEDPCDF